MMTFLHHGELRKFAWGIINTVLFVGIGSLVFNRFMPAVTAVEVALAIAGVTGFILVGFSTRDG